MKGSMIDLGHMAYAKAWEVQKDVHQKVMEGAPDTLIFVEHPPVLTLGASFHAENLLFTPEEYQQRGIEVITTDRGGDVTFHGPNQLVIYPIFDLTRHGKDLHKWMRDLEESIILLCQSLGIEAGRKPPHTGVWIDHAKVAAIGVKVKRWVSMHGIALNCNNDLAPFGWIIPCGITEYPVTSLSKVLTQDISIDDAKPLCVDAFSSVFDLEFTDSSIKVDVS